MYTARQANCMWCPRLVETRSCIVDPWVVGSNDFPPILFLAEAPGRDEDRLGEPMVGTAGTKLRGALAEVGIYSYILANAVQCWPGPGDRTPSKTEITNCSAWLVQTLRHYRPEVVVLMGAVAKKGYKATVPDLPEDYSPTIIETVHPAAVLRRPALHRRFMDGLHSAKEALDGRAPPPRRTYVTAEVQRSQGPTFYIPISANGGIVGADTETTGDQAGEVVGYSVGIPDRGIWHESPSPAQPWPYKHTIMHDAKFDAAALGIDLNNLDSWDDTMVMAYVQRYPELGLKRLASDLCDLDMLTYSEMLEAAYAEARLNGVKIRGKPKDFRLALTHVHDAAVDYAARDAVATICLYGALNVNIMGWDWHARYLNVEKPLIPILAQMERDGVRLDTRALDPVRNLLEEQEMNALGFLRSLDLGITSVNSPKLASQISRWVDLSATTDTGRLATDENALLSAVGAHSMADLATRTDLPAMIVAAICNAREARILKTTFVDGLIGRLIGDHLHCRWNQTVVPTGRLSSADPNLQNIPARSALGKQVRKAFVPEEGEIWIRADFSQLELRIMAHYTGDPTLRAAYPFGGPARDIHKMAADAMRIERPHAKNAMFEIAYGGGIKRLARTAHIPEDEAAAFWQRMKVEMPGLAAWGEDTRRRLEHDGYLETALAGVGWPWRMYFPTYWSASSKESADAFRTAVNSRIQGTAADIVKLLMLWVRPTLREIGATMLLQVHDELDFSVPPDKVEILVEVLRDLAIDIGSFMGLTVPLELGISRGPNWAEQEEI